MRHRHALVAPTTAPDTASCTWPTCCRACAAIIDKTASFVARNGPEFETRIKNEQNNVKFSFLQSNDPFHPYYRAKVVELGGTPASTAVVAAPSAEVTGAATAKTQPKTPSITPVEPPKRAYTVTKPLGANPLDLDVIQLTAQFVACNGRSFLTGIANRESKNPQVAAPRATRGRARDRVAWFTTRLYLLLYPLPPRLTPSPNTHPPCAPQNGRSLISSSPLTTSSTISPRWSMPTPSASYRPRTSSISSRQMPATRSRR